MKHSLTLIIISLLTATAVGCKEEKSSQVIIIKKPKVLKSERPQKMGNLVHSQSVNWMGSKYTVEIKRTAADSLPLATDGVKRYYDNTISLRVVRADGSVFFSRKFHKSDFKSYVGDTYYKDGALLGVAFVKAEGNQLTFGASVGSPDPASDEYVPLIVKVDNFGNYSVTKDTKADVNSMNIDPETEDE